MIENQKFIPLFLVAAVLCQEVGRFLFIKTFVYAEKSMMLRARLKNSLFSDFMSAISTGFGSGLMYALVMHGGVLSAAFDERKGGDYYDTTLCPEASVYLISAVTALLFQPFHIALSILMFHAFRKRAKLTTLAFYANIGLVFLFHFSASLASALNTFEGGCVKGVPVTVAVVLVTCGYAVYTVRKSDYVAVLSV